MVDENDLLEVVNYDTIMRQQGYFVGYYGCTLAKNVVEEVKDKLGDNILVAKGMYIMLYVNGDSPVMIMSTVLEGLESLVSEDTCVIFDFIIDNNIPDENMEYEVLLSGIINSEN